MRGFVKFFGTGKDRRSRLTPTIDELERTGAHWAGTYPENRRPRSVRDGDLMFMARLVADPNDILVYGRAIALRHVPGRDDASLYDIARRPWKERWPHYIRVHEPEFIDGTLGDGVSLNELMDELGANAFASTAENAARGEGNVDPRQAIRQAAAVRLSAPGVEWLEQRLASAFDDHGKIGPERLARLDWPDGEGVPV